MDLLWVRHGEPERIESGHRRARRSGPDRARAANRPTGSPRGSRPNRIDVVAVEPATRARRDRGADRASRTVSTSRSSTGSSSTTCSPTTTSRWRSCARRRTTAGWRWSRGGGRSSAARPPTCSAPGSRATRRRDRRRAPGQTRRRRLPRRRDQRRPRGACSASTHTSGSIRATRRSSRMIASRTGVRSVAVAQRARAPRRHGGRPA